MTDDIATTIGGIIPEAVLMRKIIDAMIPVVDEIRVIMTITETEGGIATGIRGGQVTGESEWRLPRLKVGYEFESVRPLCAYFNWFWASIKVLGCQTRVFEGPHQRHVLFTSPIMCFILSHV